MKKEDNAIRIEVIEYLKLIIRDYFRLNGDKPLTLEELNTFFDLQKEFIRSFEEDENPSDEELKEAA